MPSSLRVQLEPVHQIERFAFTPSEAAVASGRTRTRVFAAIRSGELVARKDGKATLVEREELVRWIKTFPVIRRSSGPVDSSECDRL